MCPHARHGMQALQEKNWKYVFGRTSRSLLGGGRAAKNWSNLGLVVIFSNIHVSSCATSVAEETPHV